MPQPTNQTSQTRRDAFSACAQLLVVVAKTPRAGQVKTRLIGGDGGLDAAQTAMLARAFLTDTLATCANPVLRNRTHLRLALDDGGGENIGMHLLADVPHIEAFEIVPQIGATLGERLQNLFASGFAEGYKSVCAIGGDAPHLPLAYLIEAFGWLTASDKTATAVPAHCPDVVLAPADDGGYCLVGLRETPQPGLFENIAWGGPTVFDETTARARDLDLRVALLPPFYDVDTPADLRRLRSDLARGVTHAPATNQLLRELHISTGGRGADTEQNRRSQQP